MFAPGRAWVNAGEATAFVDALAQHHLDAAYNLGHWFLGNDQDAADAVHDAFVRAIRSVHTYAGGNARAWWLAIVRNCCLAKLTLRGRETNYQSLDDSRTPTLVSGAGGNEVEAQADASQRRALIVGQLRKLPAEFREVLVLREFEDLSYREIADTLNVPIGTVMSRLARGRELLQRALDVTLAQERPHGL